MADQPTPTALFKSLADDTRARLMLLILGEGELCVCELTCALGESQPKISRHLAQLRSAGLLADRRQGQWVYYRLHPELPDWVQALLRTTLEANRPWLSPAAQRLEAMGERPLRAAACC
ncbi:metalloregulator ArsR/SmtB family transcription factor [Pseudomonas sp. MBLB4136]|uniref:metalloregulator ArsR/SmtB family transcription factor n=1 Tax=Pseudomonas sp. MBLB4136 TaxID=3451558 RepID=UPI003F74FB55